MDLCLKVVAGGSLAPAMRPGVPPTSVAAAELSMASVSGASAVFSSFSGTPVNHICLFSRELLLVSVMIV